MAELGWMRFANRRSKAQPPPPGRCRPLDNVQRPCEVKAGHWSWVRPAAAPTSGGSVCHGDPEEARPGHLDGSLQRVNAADLGERLVPGPLFAVLR